MTARDKKLWGQYLAKLSELGIRVGQRLSDSTTTLVFAGTYGNLMVEIIYYPWRRAGIRHTAPPGRVEVVDGKRPLFVLTAQVAYREEFNRATTINVVNLATYLLK